MAIRRRTVSAPRPPAEYTPELGARDALRIADSKGLKNIPLDVLGLASSIGLQVEFLLLPDDVSGFLKRKDGGWTIGINSRHHHNRQRFTIAHELGHYFLHRDQGDFTDRALFRRDLQNDHREYDANSFASRLLMPEHEFRDLAIRHRDLQVIADHFQVSTAATKFRADALGQEQIVG